MRPDQVGSASVVVLPVLRSTNRSSPGPTHAELLAARVSICWADCACATCSSSDCSCLAWALVEFCSLVISKEPSASVVLITSAETSAPPSRPHSSSTNGSRCGAARAAADAAAGRGAGRALGAA